VDVGTPGPWLFQGRLVPKLDFSCRDAWSLAPRDLRSLEIFVCPLADVSSSCLRTFLTYFSISLVRYSLHWLVGPAAPVVGNHVAWYLAAFRPLPGLDLPGSVHIRKPLRARPRKARLILAPGMF